MYCSSCGSPVQEGLKYCNRCGANLVAAAPKLFAIVLVLAIAVLLVGVVGLAAIFLFAVELTGRGSVPLETIIFLVVFALVVLGIEALLIKQFSRVLGPICNKATRALQKKPKLQNKYPNPYRISSRPTRRT